MSERMKSNLIYAFNYVLEEARESDWDGIIACHQGKLSCSTWNYQRSITNIPNHMKYWEPLLYFF